MLIETKKAKMGGITGISIMVKLHFYIKNKYNTWNKCIYIIILHEERFN